MRITELKGNGSGETKTIIVGCSSVTVVKTPDPYVVLVDCASVTEKGDPLLVRVAMTRNELAHINRCVGSTPTS